MTETIKRLGSIIGNFVKEKSKIVGLFHEDTRKEPHDKEEQYNEMLYELPPGKDYHLYILLIQMKTVYKRQPYAGNLRADFY